MKHPLRSLGICAAISLVLAGCAGSTTGGNSAVVVSGKRLTIYLGQPPGGARDQPAADVLAAEQLAFRQRGGGVGSFTLRLRLLHGRELSANARTAIEDPTAIAYLGELVPGTSQVSVEIDNQQGLLELSPLDTAAYLSQTIPPVSNSLDTLYPGHATYAHTFARVVPSTAQEAKAIVGQMQAGHASSVYVADDGQRYGAAIALEVRQAARAAGLSVGGSEAQAGAIFYGASVVSPAARAGAAHFLAAAATADPSASLYVPSGLADSAFVASLSAAAQSRLVVSSPGIAPGSLPAAGHAFAQAFASAVGHRPAPQAVFGFEAMRALLAVLRGLGSGAANRAKVVSGARGLRAGSASAIGPYALAAGDTNLASFEFAHVRRGALVPFHYAQLPG